MPEFLQKSRSFACVRSFQHQQKIRQYLAASDWRCIFSEESSLSTHTVPPLLARATSSTSRQTHATMPPTVRTTRRGDGVAVIHFSNPPVNALSSQLQGAISAALRAALGDARTAAVVLYGTGSPGFFSSGADVSEFAAIAPGVNPFSAEKVWCYAGAEDARVPVVAAVGGVCFGGGLELAMCCAARVSVPAGSFALPELKLGLVPGLGGTQRLPRLVGFGVGVGMMLESRVVAAEEGVRIGLVDEVAPADSLLDRAAGLALRLASGAVPRVKALDRGDRVGSLRECTELARKFMEKEVPKLSKGGFMPQYKALVEVALYGVEHGGREGMREEARVFSKLVMSPESRAIVHMFFAARKTAKVKLDNDTDPRYLGVAPRKVAVIGGGLMGAGIATAMLAVGLRVVIKELNQKFADAARARVERNLGAKGASAMANLVVTVTYEDLADVDMVIEAALEDPRLKQKIFTELEAACRPDCIFATNTSTINLDLIGMGAPKAHASGRIIGAHFFSPAHRMPLLEIVRTETTSAKVIKDVLALGKKIKKTPVVVGNCAGFAVNRMYFPQSMVASFLVVQLGIDPYRIDAACESFGLAMGPFRLLDLVGLDIGVAVGGVFSMAYADRAVSSSPVITSMLEAGRKGQKTGAGFYKYAGKSRVGKPDKSEVAPFVQAARQSAGESQDVAVLSDRGAGLTDDEIVEMILLACVNEGCRILDERVALSPADLDVCSVMGMAFPSFRGGLMYWAQTTFGGAGGVLKRLQYFFSLSNRFILFKPSLALERAARARGALGKMVYPTLMHGMPEDIVVVSALRTAVGRAGRGGFKDTLPDNLMRPVLEETLRATKVRPEDVGDIVAGTVLSRGDTALIQLRVAGVLAGLPVTVPVRTVNRLCSSGIQAIADAAAGIQAGHYDIAIAGGIESMSSAAMKNTELKPNPAVNRNKEAASCYITMGETSENVAAKYGISRERQDMVAVTSHARASAAKLAGRQRTEIVPVKTKVKVIDRETGKVTGIKDVVVNADEGVRVGVTMDRLAKLPAVFKKGGSTTPGNSSQLSDGAAMVMLMRRSEAVSRGLSPLASLRSYAVVGVDPLVMGIGPAVAIPAALKKAGITVEDVDLFEINEAFGSQADYCIEKLGLNRDNVNVMGGAIAIGHPLGMTGARLSVSIIHELRRRQGRFGVVSMCIGSGMGAAAVYEVNAPEPSLSARL